MSKEQALMQFCELVRQYGLQWGANVPADAYRRMKAIGAMTTVSERRQALGLRA